MSTHSASSSVSEKSDKRDRILRAAEIVFSQRGFYNARVSEIAREAGVADGTIYLYFKSKDDLLYSLFEARMTQVNRALSEAVDAQATPQDKLRTFIRTHLSLVAKQPEVAEVLTVELRQSSKFMKEYNNPHFADFLKILAAIIAEGQKKEVFNAELAPPLFARAIFGMLDELALVWLLGDKDKFDIVRAADSIGAFTIAGLERRKS